MDLADRVGVCLDCRADADREIGHADMMIHVSGQRQRDSAQLTPTPPAPCGECPARHAEGMQPSVQRNRR
jgi:hypothetical protein